MPLLFCDVGGGLVGVVLNGKKRQAGREEAGAGEGEDDLAHQRHVAPRRRIKQARPPMLVSIKQPTHPNPHYSCASSLMDEMLVVVAQSRAIGGLTRPLFDPTLVAFGEILSAYGPTLVVLGQTCWAFGSTLVALGKMLLAVGQL